MGADIFYSWYHPSPWGEATNWKPVFLKPSRALRHSVVWREWAEVTLGGDTPSHRSGSNPTKHFRDSPGTLGSSIMRIFICPKCLGINETKLVTSYIGKVFERFLFPWANLSSSFIKVKEKHFSLPLPRSKHWDKDVSASRLVWRWFHGTL